MHGKSNIKFIYSIYNHNWRNISTIYTYITRLASNEIFSPSNKIHREVGRAKDLSAPLYMLTPLYSHWNSPKCFRPQEAVHRKYWYISYKTLLFDLIFPSGHVLLTLLKKCISTPWGWTLEGWNTKKCYSVIKVVFTYISSLAGFLCKILSSVHGYGQDKVQECYLFFRQLARAALWSPLLHSIEF
jgi:hypothetical protein